MKGFDSTGGHLFEEPFITYHLERAHAGDYDSARWLRDNLKNRLAAGTPVDLHVMFAVSQMRKGGLRRSRQKKGRGKRGKTVGDHHQLLFAREMWKQINLARLTIRGAAQHLSKPLLRSQSSVINAYYRFTKTKEATERRAFRVELSRDYLDYPETWEALATCPVILSRALKTLAKLPSF